MLQDTVILGVDPGLADMGFGIIKACQRKMQMICYGVIETTPKQSQGWRLCRIYDDLESVIEKYLPKVVAMETLYFARNVKSALFVSQAIGVITLCVQKHGLPLYSYTPNQIKLGVSGTATAKKALVQKSVQLLLGLEDDISPHHAADALAVAITHYMSFHE